MGAEIAEIAEIAHRQTINQVDGGTTLTWRGRSKRVTPGGGVHGGNCCELLGCQSVFSSLHSDHFNSFVFSFVHFGPQKICSLLVLFSVWFVRKDSHSHMVNYVAKKMGTSMSASYILSMIWSNICHNDPMQHKNMQQSILNNALLVCKENVNIVCWVV